MQTRVIFSAWWIGKSRYCWHRSKYYKTNCMS